MNVDTLTPQDVDQLSRLIADALQVVDQDKGPNRGPTRVRPGPRDLGEEPRDAGDEEEEEAARDEEEDRLLEGAPTLKPQESSPAMPAALQGNFYSDSFLCFYTIKVLSRKLEEQVCDKLRVAWVGLNKRRRSEAARHKSAT